MHFWLSNLHFLLETSEVSPRTFGDGNLQDDEISLLLKITDHFHFECTETHSAENGFSVHQSELGALNLLSVGFVIWRKKTPNFCREKFAL